KIADLLAELLNMQGTTYGLMARNDKAADAWRERLELAEHQRATPRATHWKEIERHSLTNLHSRYEALGRYSEALKTAQAKIQLLREMNSQPDSAPYPEPLLSALLSAAGDAAAISEGDKAFDYLSQALDHAQRHLTQLRDAGQNPETEYTPFSTI